MTASSNKKLIQEIFAQLATGESSLFTKSLADNVTMRVTGQCSWSNTFHGKEELLRRLYAYVGTITRQPRKLFALNIVAEGDYVMVEARGEMVASNGARYDNEYCLIYKIENGMIVELREYQDSALCERVLGKYPEHLAQG